MVIDSNKAVLYSTGDQKLLHGLDLKKQSYYNHLKMSNSQPSELSIDEEANRLYCATREGLLLILDISSKDHPVLVHMMKMVINPSNLGTNFIKQMHFDIERHLLVCRMSSGVIYLVQLFRPPNESSS